MDCKIPKVEHFLKTIKSASNSENFIRENRKFFENIKLSDDFQQKLKYFNALSNELRYMIYQLLQKQELCTCVLADIVNMSEPTITHHLKILSEAGLIIAERQGLFTIYYTKENFKKIKYNE